MTATKSPISRGQHYQNFISQEQIVSEPLSGDTPAVSPWQPEEVSLTVARQRDTTGPAPLWSPGAHKPPWTSCPGCSGSCVMVPVHGGDGKGEEILDDAFLDNYSTALAGL